MSEVVDFTERLERDREAAFMEWYEKNMPAMIMLDFKIDPGVRNVIRAELESGPHPAVTKIYDFAAAVALQGAEEINPGLLEAIEPEIVSNEMDWSKRLSARIKRL